MSETADTPPQPQPDALAEPEVPVARPVTAGEPQVPRVAVNVKTSVKVRFRRVDAEGNVVSATELDQMASKRLLLMFLGGGALVFAAVAYAVVTFLSR